MTKLWEVPESCRTLPGEKLEDGLQAAKELIQRLRNPGSKAPLSDSREKWTLWIKTNLYRLICKQEFYISPSGPSTTKGEYLTLDVTVEEKEFPKRIVLAVESEIDDTKYRRQAIEKDFEKLLAVKSPFKLMIYSTEKRGFTNENATEMFEHSLEGYGHHLRGETYIFIDYNEDSEDNGSLIAHTWQSDSNGLPSSPRLLPAN